MANISDVYGCIELIGDWTPRQIKMLLYIFYALDTNTYYNTRIGEPREFEDILENTIRNAHLTFVGAGRWAYSANIESFISWSKITDEKRFKELNKYLPEKYKLKGFSTYQNLHRNFIKEMAKNKLQLYFNYKEFESGVGSLVEIQDTLDIVYNAQLKKYNSICNNTSIQNYECNLKNYCEIFLEENSLLYENLYSILTSFINKTKSTVNIDTAIDLLEDKILKHDTWYDIPIYVCSSINSSNPNYSEIGISTELIDEITQVLKV
jgi:hypothetical protein